LLKAIAAKHQVELIGFAQDAWEVRPDQWDQLFTAGKPGSTRMLSATDLRLPLTHALERSGPDLGRLIGVVVLTDGQHNWGPSPVAKALEMGERQLPLYPIALGARQSPPDITLVSIKAPPTVFKDVDVAVEARVKVSGLPAQDLLVTLQGQGLPALEERIRHDGHDRAYNVRFQTRLEQAGTQALTVTAKPVPGEIRTDNNSRPVVITVADDKAKILLIDGEARWEYHYLANALARDPTVQMQNIVFAQPRVGAMEEDELEKLGNPRRSLPTEPDGLSSFDCIILGDVAPSQLPLAERKRLENYVADRGGTLVVLAGKRSMPLAYLDEPGKPALGDPLLNLLPLEEPRAVHPVDGFPITLAAAGKLASFFQLDSAPGQNESRWAELPHHFWGVIGRAKPGATPLAYYEMEEAATDPKTQASREKDQALILWQNYGFGRVLFVGVDSTWRWRYKVGDAHHHRFWGQVVRWAASEKPLAVGNEYVRFGTREPVYRHGQEVDLTVRLAEQAGVLRPEAMAGARVLRQGNAPGDPEEAVALVPLTRRPAQPRVLEGRLRDLPAGQYAIELVIPDLEEKLRGPTRPDGKSGKLRAPFTVVPADEDEMIELATNWPLLEELAAKSGGQVFTPENAAELVKLLTSQVSRREHHTEHRLWQWWVTLAILLGLLTLEWIGRKWAGLP
jgi:hypothetical protein